MSAMIYLASDAPIPARPNPHDQVMSVNEALAADIEELNRAEVSRQPCTDYCCVIIR